MYSKTDRKEWIDCVRGAAIILVVLGHIDLGQNPLCKWISSFHMPIFFMLSGVLAAARGTQTDKPVFSLLAGKAKRLLYPYLTFSSLIILYNWLQHGSGAASSILRDTITLEGHSVMWFLPALFTAECMFLILRKSRIPNSVGCAALVAGTTLYAALQYYAIGGAAPAQVSFRYQFLNFFCRAGISTVFMQAGYFGYQQKALLNMLGKRRTLCLAISAFALGFACCWLNGMPDLHYSVLRNPVLYYLSALLQGGALIIIFAIIPLRYAVLVFFGQNSLIIMATHYTFPLIRYARHLTTPLHTGMRYLDDLIICTAVMLAEAAIIFVIRKWTPFMLRFPASKH